MAYRYSHSEEGQLSSHWGKKTMHYLGVKIRDPNENGKTAVAIIVKDMKGEVKVEHHGGRRTANSSNCTMFKSRKKPYKQVTEPEIVGKPYEPITIIEIVILCKFKTTVTLHPLAMSPPDIARQDADKPEMEVAVSVPDPLLSESYLLDSNLLKVTVEALYSAPDSWNLSGPPFNYVISLQLPMIGEKEFALIFANGVLKSGTEKEPSSRPKKWPQGNILAPGAQYIPESFIQSTSYEEEDGELNRKEDRDFRLEAETDKRRVMWDTERRCFIDPAAVLCFQKRIAECRFWPIEIMKIPQIAGVKGGGGKPGKGEKAEDDGQISSHGVAYINMAPLLYPGVQRIRGAYQVVAFNEAEVFSKTKRQHSVLREVVRQGSVMGKAGGPISMASPSTRQGPAKGSKDDKATKEKETLKKASAILKPSTSETVADVEQPVILNLEGQQYVDAKSYIVVEFALEKPLVPKRPPEELATRVKELIPPRPALPHRTAGAQKAVNDYHSQITSIAAAVLEEYQELFKHDQGRETPVDYQTLEEQKRKLNYELNFSGKYFAFKEQLKHAVVKIVREKYLKTVPFEDMEQLQTFLSELYIYLVDQMHIALNKTLSMDVPDPVPQSFLDLAQLKHFAREAEINEDFNLAAKYYKERLARDRNNPDHWFDYGCFCLLISDNGKAEECFHEAVALDQRHLNSLLLSGVMAALGEQYKNAETFFEDATCINPGSILAWTLLGLFYETEENIIGSEMAFQEANKQLQIQMSSRQSTEEAKVSLRRNVEDFEETGEVSGPEKGPKEGDAAFEGAGITEIGTASAPDDSTSASVSSKQPAGLVHKSGSATTIKSKKAPQKGPSKGNDSESGTMMQYHTNGILPKISPQESKLSEVSAQPCTTIYIETAHFLLQVNALPFVQRALAHELLCPEGGPSCRYHIALARFHLTRKEFHEAEENLEKAVQINHRDPDAWALTGHLQYLNKNYAKAKECYERTTHFITDASEMHPVYLRLGSIYLQEEEYEKAKNTYLMACKNSPSCLSWLGVGIACYRLEELTEAEDALSEANVLNNTNAEVWGYLALVCLQTGRQLEAEQSFKYAVKLNLQNEALLQEIHRLQELVGFGNPAF
ncbi:cilia- and flagella-associated protein 70 [Protopterus annectens]|uniref:cilia- and flagella-associated protein 70 n=1 Tax=Protopterus annectens TaxID=7888 RepID=UPI001CFB6CE4|nr:cilia- and flagella-associated protein 70 [Protopterus annectens]